MKKWFLHIGPNKTGSTYIQKHLLANREELLSLGLNYPSFGIGPQYGHHQLFENIKKLGQEELDEYVDHFSGAAVNFVSSEKFSQLKPEDVAKFGKSLSKVNVQVIFFHRNYVDLLPSHWQERVKHKSRLSFYEFLFPHVFRPFSSSIINPDVVLDSYATAFGKDHITVIDYDTALKTGDILRPILELTGVELSGVKNEVVNRSLTFELVEIIRALNITAERKDELHSYDVRTIFLRKRKERAIQGEVEALAAVIRDHMKPLRLDGSPFVKSVNTAFIRKYGSCLFNRPLDELPSRELLVPRDSWMLQRVAVDACERIYQYILAGDVLDSERGDVAEVDSVKASGS